MGNLSFNKVNLQIAREKLIVALDVADCEQAEKLVKELGDEVSFYKIGMELIYHDGLELARILKKQGKKIFIDAKLHDIPRTVLSAARNIAQYKADILTVHCNASCLEAFKIYQDELEKQNNMKWCFVTILTSEYATKKKVLDLANKAIKAGAHGLIASAQEAKILRENFGNDFTLITPGIRPKWANPNDQKRTATPLQAVKAGVDYLVVGRPITQAANKKKAARTIIEEIAQAMEAPASFSTSNTGVQRKAVKAVYSDTVENATPAVA